MPSDPTILTSIMLGSLVSASFTGISLPQLATGIGTGLSLYAKGMTISSIDTGVLGAGTGIGPGIIMPPQLILQSMTASFIAGGFIGSSCQAMSTAVATGCVLSFAQFIVNTINPTVGVGSGIAKPIPNPNLSVSSFLAGLTGAGVTGNSAQKLAVAISSGLDPVLLACTSILVIAGSPSQVPGAGTGVGRIL